MKTRLLSLMLPMAVCSIAYANNPELDLTEVTIVNDVIYYKGVLSPEGNDLAFELYENAKEKPTTLAITSDGGDIMLGIELGEWIYNNKMSVEVNDYCLSSCANYVFPSGKIKYISNRDMLFSLPKKEREEEKRRLLSDMQRYLKTAKAKEKEYFQKIKVNQTITTLGQDEKYSIYDTNRYSGWTYRLTFASLNSLFDSYTTVACLFSLATVPFSTLPYMLCRKVNVTVEHIESSF